MRWGYQIFSLELRKLMSYRMDFWVQFIFPTLGGLALAYFLWSSIYASNGVTHIEGYSLKGMILYYYLVSLVERVVLGMNWKEGISMDIYQGTLNRYLVYPISFFGVKIWGLLAGIVFALIQLLLALGLYRLFFIYPTEMQVNTVGVLTGLLVSFYGGLVCYLIHACIELVAFWADSVWSLQVMFRFAIQLFGGALAPLVLFPQWAQEALSWTPFPLLFSVPIRTILGLSTHAEIIQALSMGAIWAMIVGMLYVWVWNRGLKSYTGVGM